MSKNIRTTIQIAVVSVIALFISTPIASAIGMNATWRGAVTLDQPLEGKIVAGVLGVQGDSAFYRFTSAQPTTVRVRLGVPIWTSEKFQPQLVLYQPEPIAIGPVLPMEQPPSTAAVIYPAVDWTLQYDQAAMISYIAVLDTELVLPQAGEYWLAVYNTGTVAGRWRLQFGEERTTFGSLFTWPSHWWRFQAWAGWSLQTTFVPLTVLAVVLAVHLFHRHHHIIVNKNKKKKL